jgi:hypothetical protein
MVRRVLSGIELGATTLIIVAALVGIRAVLLALGVDGMTSTPLSTGIITGAIFVMGLVIAGTLADLKDAERAPVDIAAGLHALLREGEAMHAKWGKPDISKLRQRLIAVVTTLRADIDAGDSRTAQAAVEDLGETFLELEDTEVPANYIVRQRSEQAGLRKALLRIYHLQREEFLPSAYALIVTFVAFVLGLLMLTDFGGTAESLVAVGFLSFFFLALLRLLNIISKPYKVGVERTDDDVSLFLLSEFVVHVQASEAGEVVVEDVEAMAEDVEEALVEVEQQEHDADAAKTAEQAAARLASDA